MDCNSISSISNETKSKSNDLALDKDKKSRSPSLDRKSRSSSNEQEWRKRHHHSKHKHNSHRRSHNDRRSRSRSSHRRHRRRSRSPVHISRATFPTKPNPIVTQPINFYKANKAKVTAPTSAAGAPSVSLPSYYNPETVDPVKYAERMQKRKLLWSSKKAQDVSDSSLKPISATFIAAAPGDTENTKPNFTPSSEARQVNDSGDKVNMTELYWKKTAFSDTTQTEKFRKLMGIKKTANNNGSTEIDNDVVLTEEEKQRRQELYERLNRQYEVARMSTHTMRGMGLGFASNVIGSTPTNPASPK